MRDYCGIQDEKPLVSIVVPIYNVDSYLVKLIETLINQDYDNIEIILVDDGSVDDSAKICDNYRMLYPEKIKVFHKENGGVASARNMGIENAIGDWICFPDGDDYVDYNYISSFINGIVAETGVDMVCTGWNTHCANKIDTSPGQGIYILEEPNHIKEYYKGKTLMFDPPWNKLYNLELIRDNNVRFKPLKIGEDGRFNFDYMLLCKKIYVDYDMHTYHYMVRCGSATNDMVAKKYIQWYEDMKERREILQNSDYSEYVGELTASMCPIAVVAFARYIISDNSDKRQYNYLRQEIGECLCYYWKNSTDFIGKMKAVLAYIMPYIYSKIYGIGKKRYFKKISSARLKEK